MRYVCVTSTFAGTQLGINDIGMGISRKGESDSIIGEAGTYGGGGRLADSQVAQESVMDGAEAAELGIRLDVEQEEPAGKGGRYILAVEEVELGRAWKWQHGGSPTAWRKLQPFEAALSSTYIWTGRGRHESSLEAPVRCRKTLRHQRQPPP